MLRNPPAAERRTLEYPAETPLVPTRKNYARHGILATALLLGLTLVSTTWFAWRSADALADTVSEGQGELYLRAFHDFSMTKPKKEAFQALVETYAEHGLRGAGMYDANGNFVVMAGAFQEPQPPKLDRPHGRDLIRVDGRYRIMVHLPAGGPRFGGPSRGFDKPPRGNRPLPERPPFRPPFPPPEGFGPPSAEGDSMPEMPNPGPGFPPPPPMDRPMANGPMEAEDQSSPTLGFEFEPLLAVGLMQRARMTFFLATGVATLLAIAAIVLWRRAEREEMLGARLAQTERLASLGTMSAVLAHEIKNPLASLKGNAQLLAESLPFEGRSRAQADRVVEAALRLQGLVQNLLDFARGGPIERTETDPAELLFLAAEDAAPAADLDLDRAPATWSLDAIRIRQVLENLLRNAVQASNEGEVQARVFVEEDQLVYIVEDDGPGFPKDSLENLFEPFVTTKSRGVGLGLAVARRIIVMHGGTIAAKNKDGGGAEICVRIPQMRTRREDHGADSRGG